MKDFLVHLRNRLFSASYRIVFRPIFFAIDPEKIHDWMTLVGRVLGSNPVTRFFNRVLFDYSNPALEQTLLGIHFKNPLGLSAGFDKNAQMIKLMPCVGFGFEEVGSITGEPCAGNPKPRLWRHKDLKSIRVYYGLMNDGCLAIAKRLKGQKFTFPVGTSIAKTNNPETCETEAGIADYLKAFKAMAHIGAYSTINISCPNAFGGQPFTDLKKLEALLIELDKVETKKATFLKLSPDLSEEEVVGILDVASKHRVDGYVCTNLTKKHSFGNGGLSGKAVADLSNQQIRWVYKKTKGKALIIGCGGIFSAEDAYEKLKAGASLLQLITGMIYEGPQVLSEINQGLVELMKKDGYTSIAQIKRG